MSMPKIDAKEVALDGDEGKEILASLSIFENIIQFLCMKF